jgi:hypothetical protein
MPVNLALNEGSTKTEGFNFYQEKKASSVKKADLRIGSKFLKGCLYIKQCGISLSLVSYSLKFFSYEDSRKQRKRTLMKLKRRWSYPKLPVVTLLLSKGVEVNNSEIRHR